MATQGWHVLVEKGEIISVINDDPALLPPYIEHYSITEEEAKSLFKRTHIFDMGTHRVIESQDYILKAKNDAAKLFLTETDWKVLRHIRQKALGLQTSLTEEEYLALELERQKAAESITGAP